MGIEMGAGAKKGQLDRFVSPILFVLGACFLFQTSCTILRPTAKTAKAVEPGRKGIKGRSFRSDEYVVYRLKGGERPETLARGFLGDEKKSWMIEDANEGIPFKRGQLIVIPLKEENKGGVTREGYQVVPVLSYHHFAQRCSSPFCIPADVFAQQMRYLKEKGYRVISMDDFRAFIQYRHALPKRSVVITIDDGYRSAYSIAYPILQKYGFTATLFIYTDYVGVSKRAITWNQLREMKRAGFIIGSQTLSHSDLKKQREGEDAQAYLGRVRRELLVSKQILDKTLGQNTIYLGYPYGRYNDRVLRISDQVGYKLAFSVKRGGNPFFSDPLKLRRDQVLKRDLKTFRAVLKTFQTFSVK